MTHQAATPKPGSVIDSTSAKPRLAPAAWIANRLSRLSPEAILVGLGLFVLLAVFVSADPSSHATVSVAPFTDEAGNLENARNFVQLGTWSTDQWNLYLVNLPFSLLLAAWFQLVGVGIVQARLVMIACTSLTAAALVWGLRDIVGRGWATFAGLAFAASGLILFYGRLAFLEDLVVLGLTLGTLVLARPNRVNARGGALAGIFYAIAIGTKPSALFAVFGILVVLGIVWGRRDPAMRRWLVASAGIIAVAGLLWVVAIWLPNRNAVSIDMKIWPPYQWNLTPVGLLNSIKRYIGSSDSVLGIMLLPLIALASAGMVSIVALRRRLAEPEARMAAAAFAWAAFGFGILLVASYRPNRYVVPLVPALAILAAIGLHLFTGWLREQLDERPAPVAAAQSAAASPAAPAARDGRARRMAASLIAAAAILVAVSPGLLWYGNWARDASHDLVAIQNQFANAVPAGETVAGANSELFLMRSRAKTVIIGLANDGNLYSEGTRWYLLQSDAAAPEGVPDSVWTARERVMCSDWRGGVFCLFHLP